MTVSSDSADFIPALHSKNEKTNLGNIASSAKGTAWKVSASVSARTTVNPMRHFVENANLAPNPAKPLVDLSIGDPTVFGNFLTPSSVIDAVKHHVDISRYHGYAPSVGQAAARRAIAKHHTTDSAPLTEHDVIITSGCSDSLDIAMGVLANPGDNILIPCPGFSLYQTICLARGIHFRPYQLLPERQYEADLHDLESKIDEKTVAILVNNPSNPCGSVYSKKHLQDILAIADKFKLPIIADEIYEWNVFSPNKFIPMATLTSTVPILTCTGLGKAFIVPGWRVGWILVHDRNGIFNEVRKGLTSMAQVILGANTLIQSCIPEILEKTPQSYFDANNHTLKVNADFLVSEILTIPGLKPIAPQGAMYLMVKLEIEKFHDIKDDFDFTKKLMQEESVFCVPGQIFLYPNYVRLILMPPKDQLAVAMTRLREFCAKHYKN